MRTALTCAVLALCGCGVQSSGAVTLNGKRVETGALVSRQVSDETASTADALSVPAIANAAAVTGQPITPKTGRYNPTGSYVSIDTCGFSLDNAQANPRFLKSVSTQRPLVVSWEWHDAVDDTVSLTTQCTIDAKNGRTYVCATDDQIIDFAFMGLDAKMTIKSPTSGAWLTDSSFVEYSGSSLSCVGKDCSKEPAAHFFGNIKNRMPCVTRAVTYQALAR